MKPIEKYKSGRVSVAVWQKDGGNRSHTFQYSYKDQQGNWKNTEFIPEYALQDLLALITALSVKAVLTPEVKNPSPTYQQEPTIPSASNPTGRNDDTDGLSF